MIIVKSAVHTQAWVMIMCVLTWVTHGYSWFSMNNVTMRARSTQSYHSLPNYHHDEALSIILQCRSICEVNTTYLCSGQRSRNRKGDAAAARNGVLLHISWRALFMNITHTHEYRPILLFILMIKRTQFTHTHDILRVALFKLIHVIQTQPCSNL